MNPLVNLAPGTRVFVGLSGGVDSAVTAALLVRAGVDVTGVFIKGWYPEGMPCTWASDRRDAMRVAARLRIPFLTLDGSAAYKKSVIDYLRTEYAAGRTPNPDVMCNRDVKFGVFHAFAKAQGAAAIATGHYARTESARLFRGVDEAKDQSYFLWAVSREALADTLFPLGGYRKTEVRALARRFHLPVAEKKDSQGICFLGPVSVEDFLRSEFGETPGTAVDEKGRDIGRHDGVLLHTLGERIALHDAEPGPWYVLRKDIGENVLTVSRERHSADDASRQFTLSSANWFEGKAPSGEVSAQYRYHGPSVVGRIEGAAFLPSEPVTEPVAGGQSLVLYRGDECLGGAIIA